MIDLLLLGNGAMMPLPQRWLSSLLVRVDRSLILFDCGEGTQIPWRTYHWGFKRLDAICLTHHHADHIAGLPGLFYTVANAGRTEPMTIYGPPGTIEIVKGLRVIAPDLPYDMIVQELEGGSTFALPGGLQARAEWGLHRIPVLAYRVEKPRQRAFDAERATALGIPREHWEAMRSGASATVNGMEIPADTVLGPPRRGVSFAFVTDTRPMPELVRLAEDVDLLICEGTYGDDADLEKAERHGHMTFSQAASIAREAGAGALWLTHFGAGMTDPAAFLDRATAIFPKVVLGASGLTGQLAFGSGYRTVSSDGDTSRPPVPVRVG
ncbi:MAG: ribonuclease Z [Thermomicrobiales bacterium]